MTVPLDVWLYGRRTGRLERHGRALRFTYATDYVEAGGAPLSHSLPVRTEPFETVPAHSFFSNLLPEGTVRQHVARRFGVSIDDDLGLLAEIGGDCAGAISLLPPGMDGKRRDTPEGVRWLDPDELAAALVDLPRRPLLADPEAGIRLSLAGAQDKLPVVVREGRIGVPLGPTPSTHIVKAPIERLEDTVRNEAFCLALARRLGLPTAAARVEHAGPTPYLLVTRFDRSTADGRIERLHQEDLCQALGVPPERKYEDAGGPGLADCVEVIRAASATPARDVPALVDAVAFNLVIGNHDAHGKNFALLRARESTGLAPLYDLVSTSVYGELSRKLAMRIGGESRPPYVRRRHVERFAEAAGLGGAAVRRRMARLAAGAPQAAREVVEDDDGAFGSPVVERIVETVERRARQLADELARG